MFRDPQGAVRTARLGHQTAQVGRPGGVGGQRLIAVVVEDVRVFGDVVCAHGTVVVGKRRMAERAMGSGRRAIAVLEAQIRRLLAGRILPRALPRAACDVRLVPEFPASGPPPVLARKTRGETVERHEVPWQFRRLVAQLRPGRRTLEERHHLHAPRGEQVERALRPRFKRPLHAALRLHHRPQEDLTRAAEAEFGEQVGIAPKEVAPVPRRVHVPRADHAGQRRHDRPARIFRQRLANRLHHAQRRGAETFPVLMRSRQPVVARFQRGKRKPSRRGPRTTRPLAPVGVFKLP